MSFITDKQTLDDLNIPGKYRTDSVFSLFNKVKTRGGERWLEELFRGPLTNATVINQRTEAFRYFVNNSLEFPITPANFAIVEEYLQAPGKGNIAATALSVVTKKLLRFAVRDDAYQVLHDQLITTIAVLNTFHDFLKQLPEFPEFSLWLQELNEAKKIFSQHSLIQLLKQKGIKKITASRIIQYDHQLRAVHAQDMARILETIYKLDVFIAVAGVARNKHLHFANAAPRGKDCLSMRDLRHPCIEKAVGNAVSMEAHSNVIFLTGANMAGKSTFMKSFGIALYLAHMGFPVAAEEMVFSVKDGLYTSINVPDDLAMGYSHFYAEVLRVKTVAQQIAKGLQLVIIFDELFKGTNVKDAYDATVAITSAFARKTFCFFIISTHITEAGEDLRQRHDNLQFVFFPSILKGNSPVYTYKLETGISNDKHGMVILKREGVFELIRAENYSIT